MTREQKAKVIEQLTSSFKDAEAIAICDYKGLTVEKLETLRNQVRAIGGCTQVVKNTLANIAFKNVDKNGYSLVDTNVLIWGDDSLQVAKTVAKYAKENDDNFKIKKAYLDGEFKDADALIELSKMPGREELLGMLLSVWTAPVRYFVTGLDNLSKKLEENN